MSIVLPAGGLSQGKENVELQYQGRTWVGVGVKSLTRSTHLGEKSIELIAGSPTAIAYIHELEFQAGVIEFDIATLGRSAPGIGLYGDESDADFDRLLFNLLPRFEDDPLDQLQQATVTVGERTSVIVNFRSPIEERSLPETRRQWFHVKLVISEDLCEVYIDDESDPVLVFNNLFHIGRGGRIGICGGSCRFANVEVKPLPDS